MTDVSCASGVALLMDYLEGVLPDDVRTALEAHVSGCPRCVAFVASYRKTPQLLRAATDSALPTDVRHSLRSFLRSQRP
jgi:anti-sigma factor RsiW